MILTTKQEQAINIMSKNYRNKEPITVISGFAGSGKSSIINHFIEANDLMETTRFVTFTGKASLVLQNKGLPATTIHKLIYDAYKNWKTGKFYFRLKPALEGNIKLIVIDEVSMVPMNLLVDLLSFGIPIICLGDPGQLEPIGEDNGLLKSPDMFLDEIHRQAQDNSIIRLSMLVRENKELPIIKDDPYVKVLSKQDLSLGMMMWADQIICAKNATRRGINAEVREYLNYEGDLPVVGDKVICLHNYWDMLNEDFYPLINGTIGNVKYVNTGADNGILGQKTFMNFQSDYSKEQYYGLEIDSNIFKGYAPLSKTSRSKRIVFEFDFGYAITCHKAQGSSYEKVLVYEEILRRESHNRWLYTAITRASEQVVVIKSN